MDDLLGMASRFRWAVDSAHAAGEFDGDVVFRRFPNGCCDDASILLARYLHDHDVMVKRAYGVFCSGGFQETRSHVWLLADGGTIIDITGDQFRCNSLFDNFDVPVYVGPSNEFYEMFEDLEIQGYESLRIESLARDCRPRLLALYEVVMRYMYVDWDTKGLADDEKCF